MTPGSFPQPVVTNQSMVLFSSAAGIDAITYSNTVHTPVLSPVLSLFKSADKTSVSLGETLVYSLVAKNSGNVAARATIRDILPEGVSFIANSVLRDGVPLPGVSPSSGIPLGTISPQAQVRIAFQAIVVSLPPSLELRNEARGFYSFTTPEGRLVQSEIRSNPVTVSLLSFQLSTLLAASTPTTFTGDVVTYTLLLRNEGARLLNDIIAFIPVPDGAIFVPGSVVAGGIYYPDADPAEGIRLGFLSTDTAAEISFRVRITSIPENSLLTTQARTTYQVDEVTEVTESNIMEISIVQAGVTVSLKVDRYSAAPGDNLHYKFTVQNSGNLAVNAVLVEAIPAGTLFIWDSVIVDSVPMKGIRPGEFIPLGTIRAGSVVLVEFLVSIPAATDIKQTPAVQNQGNLQYTFTLPDGRNVRQAARSNAVTTLILSPVISIEMSGEPPIVEPGGTAQFRISVTNSGNYPADVSVIRIVPQGSLIESDIVTVSALTSPESSYRGTVALGTVQAGQTVHLTYFVRINDDFMGRALQGSSTALYLFTIDGRRYSGESRSNSYRLIIEEISE